MSEFSHGRKEDSDDIFEQGDFTEGQVGKQVLADYIWKSLARGELPMPILQRITPDGSMPLINYQLNDNTMSSFAEVLNQIIPDILKKLYVINSASKDAELMNLVRYLAKTRGLETLVFMQNSFGMATYSVLADQFIPKRAFKSIKKFVLREPIPHKP